MGRWVEVEEVEMASASSVVDLATEMDGAEAAAVRGTVYMSGTLHLCRALPLSCAEPSVVQRRRLLAILP